jgi:hypothetical protein
MHGKTSGRGEQGYIFAPGESGSRPVARGAQGTARIVRGEATGAAFSLVTFSWPNKRKSPAAGQPPASYKNAAAGGSTSVPALGIEARG